MYKSPGTDQIFGRDDSSRLETIQSQIHKHINSVANKEKLPEY
jgi:hypothetical protein